MAWPARDVEGVPIKTEASSHRQIPYIPLKGRPPELLKLLNVLQRQINMSHLSGK